MINNGLQTKITPKQLEAKTHKSFVFFTNTANDSHQQTKCKNTAVQKEHCHRY